MFRNTQALLLAGIGEPYDRAAGKGVGGKNYCYQFRRGHPTEEIAAEAGAAFFEESEWNPHMGSAGVGMCIDDFNGATRKRTMPHGTVRWGSEWKRATVKWYHHVARFNTQGSVYTNRENFVDLDLTYKDAFGRSLIRMTYNGTTRCRVISSASSRGTKR